MYLRLAVFEEGASFLKILFYAYEYFACMYLYLYVCKPRACLVPTEARRHHLGAVD